MKLFLPFLLSISLFSGSLSSAAPPPADTDTLGLSAPSAILMEASTGTILYEKDANTSLHPASITKIMTAILVIENNTDFNQVITASKTAAAEDGTSLYLLEGDKLTLMTGLYGTMLRSGNDAAVAIAEHTAGSVKKFVKMMNAKAKELGMTDTHFVNCTGLPAEGHVTSAWDIALMSRELIEKHPDIRRYTTIWMDTLRDGTFQLANTNKLIRFYDGATGLKTGSTDSAKYCLSATAEREGMELIAVVLKSPTGQQRFEDAKALLNYGFSTYALLHTVPEEPFPAVPVVLGETETVQPCIDPQEAVALVQKSQAGGLSQSVTLAEQVEAPVSAGQELGTLTLTDAAGETVQSIPIRAAQSVERLTFGTMLRRMLSAAFFAG